MSNDAPKTAYELAMERLRRKDEESGREERPLTETQRAAIAEARSIAEARVAERRILFQFAHSASFDLAERAQLEQELRRDLDRIASDRDRKIEQIRIGE